MRGERAGLARRAVWERLPVGPARGDSRARRFLRIDIPPVPLDGDSFGAELATLEAVAAQATLITGAVFATDSWRVDVDILARQPDGTYLPVIVSNHRVARSAEGEATPVIATARLGLGGPLDAPYRLRHHVADGYRLALAARAVEDLGVDGGWGAAIGQDRTRAFLTPTAPLQPALTAALAEITPERLPTVPRRVKECASCRFWPMCEPELVAMDDISLFLPGDRARAFRDRGITTVTGLIDADLGEPSRLARAWRDGVPLLRRTDTVTAPRADVEIDVDMEAYLDQGAYLWGAFDGAEYHPFATWTPLGGDDEAENFARFWAWLQARRAQAHDLGLSFAAYCWSNHGENHWLTMSARRFGGRRYGDVVVPDEQEVAEFIASDEWIDLFRTVRSQLIGPFGLGLKVVAPEAGYTWADGDFDGEESVNARRLARGVDTQAMEMRERLLRYNGDDCRATAAVRDWLRRGAPGTPRL